MIELWLRLGPESIHGVVAEFFLILSTIVGIFGRVMKEGLQKCFILAIKIRNGRFVFDSLGGMHLQINNAILLAIHKKRKSCC
jgi:hypothetical protein